jgi:hypothetical protein
MPDMTRVVALLRQEREQTQKRLEQLDRALSALGGSGMRAIRLPATKRRTMSAAARKKIAAAQRARWAKWKAGRKA